MAEHSLAGLSISKPTASPQKSNDSSAHETADFASIKKYPPFYTLQPNLTTRARQLELWSSIITS
jgi:ESCRT-II complex subunit VPS25